MKTKMLFTALMLLLGLCAFAKNNTKLQVEGPENSYNMVRVHNQTHYTDFSCVVYFLEEKDGKMVSSSALGSYNIKGNGDMDSNKVRVYRGQWLGITLPDEMTDVVVSISYKDLPMFDIVNIVLTETGANVGEEF